MKSLRKYAILAALLAATIVKAQTAPPAPLSGTEMKAKIDSYKKEIDENYRHVLHVQAVVRKDKDVIKLTCVNDKLMQLKAQMDLFDTASQTLDANATDESRQATYADAEKAANSIKQLRGEADGCAGELEMYKQESKLDFERPELDDPTGGDNGFDGNDKPDIDVPGFATPFK